MMNLRYPPPNRPDDLDAREAARDQDEAFVEAASHPSVWGPVLLLALAAGMLAGVILWRFL